MGKLAFCIGYEASACSKTFSIQILAASGIYDLHEPVQRSQLRGNVYSCSFTHMT
jgi:hypothetical protein